MRKLIFVLMLCINFGIISAQELNTELSDTVWCVQVMSTRNPHLITAEMVSSFDDQAMVESVDGWYRILFLYNDKETAEIYLHSWQRQHKKAFLTIRKRKETERYYPLFTLD